MASTLPEPSFVLAEAEKLTLLAAIDAFIGDIGEEESQAMAERRGTGLVHKDEIVRFGRRTATSDCPELALLLRRKVSAGPAHDGQKLHVVLKVLSSSMGCKALAGKKGPFHKLDTKARREIVNMWQTSPFPPMREMGKAFKLLAAFAAMTSYGPQGDGVQAPNPSWRAIGYRSPDLQKLREVVVVPDSTLFDFTTCRPSMSLESEKEEIVCDVVIVGSGPGGAVVAAKLAEAGFKVAVLESANWQAPSEQSCDEAAGFRAAYQEGGNLFTEHKELTILAGAAFGGGSAVNWSCCLPPTDEVCDEWATKFGLSWAARDQMKRYVDASRERLAMHKDVRSLNGSNDVLRRGCEKMGYQWEIAAQQGHEPKRPDNGGWASLGWKYGKGQGMHGSALLDAAKTGNLILLDGCRAEKVYRDAVGRACAVKASLNRGGSKKELLVRGRTVVAAGGTLQTPLLLRRSGLRNSHIGKHLHLHPAMMVWGRFDHEVNFFEGAPMTTVSRVVENMDGQGYGAKIWCPNFHPVTFAVLNPWQGVREYKESLTGFSQAAPLLMLARDKGEGSVWEDSNGSVRVDYSVANEDAHHLMLAADRSARILVAAGAKEVHSSHTVMKPFVVPSRKEDVEPALNDWLARLTKLGIQSNTVALGSAHQMSTCRMASSSKMGALRPTGETWEVPGLFVADCSAFPTASGVNPMWSCAALAEHVSEEILDYLNQTPTLAEPLLVRSRRLGVAPCGCGGAAAPVSAPKPVAPAGDRVGKSMIVEDDSTSAGSGASNCREFSHGGRSEHDVDDHSNHQSLTQEAEASHHIAELVLASHGQCSGLSEDEEERRHRQAVVQCACTGHGDLTDSNLGLHSAETSMIHI
mmetsp:Transcript_95369/g.199524  ORF Transcript_95369/g.199524 Transcript_95369/m.199524 type:complete len:863 (-) Transcript_95369:103-2691(-)|eukprot:CAMPEP_0206431936 /NCGR_PEP_ID=MMETSP0324_2-20121206/7636_1 /ASSEMBLY_ACC=CAM_ASM_000836 /TAXON_ID=2866 /ORGANISM="Crypthecodinium cohnii, Strain Seligo" /LENGTH=862 /DNA_ID=CAMNT_0053897909 /DNA_START=72 /DNA_END=2660 /DNA_ORIENTATION=+